MCTLFIHKCVVGVSRVFTCCSHPDLSCQVASNESSNRGRVVTGWEFIGKRSKKSYFPTVIGV